MDIELIETSSQEIKCSICLNIDIEDGILCYTNCSHQFCKSCLDEWFNQGTTTCPMCRTDIKYFNFQGSNNRVVKISTNNNNRINNNMIEILSSRIILYKYIVYLLIIFNLYLYYISYKSKENIDYYKNLNMNCVNNLTDINNQLKEIHMTSLNIIYNNIIYLCSLPDYYVNKCARNY